MNAWNDCEVSMISTNGLAMSKIGIKIKKIKNKN